MRRPARPNAKSTAAPAVRPFAGLRGLLASEREAAASASTPGRADSAVKAAPDTSQTTTDAAMRGQHAADGALFRQTIGPTTALRDSGRAEIERPRPPPMLRPRGPAEDADATPVAAAQPRDALRAAYEGVIPLRASGRVELETPRRAAGLRDPSTHDGQLPAPDLRLLVEASLLQDDGRLFQHVIGDTRPLRPANRIELQKPPPSPHPVKREADERSALNESLLVPPSFEDRLEMGDETAFLRPGLPRRVLNDLRRGRWVLQGQIDLHGYNRDEARAALGIFLRDSLQQGRRCIRVIHGKGLGSPGRISILKQLSRGWLAQREEILAFCQAGPREGGEGALLVLMRAQNAAPE